MTEKRKNTALNPKQSDRAEEGLKGRLYEGKKAVKKWIEEGRDVNAIESIEDFVADVIVAEAYICSKAAERLGIDLIDIKEMQGISSRLQRVMMGEVYALDELATIKVKQSLKTDAKIALDVADRMMVSALARGSKVGAKTEFCNKFDDKAMELAIKAKEEEKYFIRKDVIDKMEEVPELLVFLESEGGAEWRKTVLSS